MKSDVIIISSGGEGMDEALLLAEKTARFKGLDRKDALHLRLLTEETLSMMRSITGNVQGRFWIEDEHGKFRLHLKVRTYVDSDKRARLLSASTSGKNEASRGIMGRIRTFFDPLDGVAVPFNAENIGSNEGFSWSMRAYEQSVQSKLDAKEAGAEEDRDELEKSIVSHLADDVKVSIEGRDVEMIIIVRMK